MSAIVPNTLVSNTARPPSRSAVSTGSGNAPCANALFTSASIRPKRATDASAGCRLMRRLQDVIRHQTLNPFLAALLPVQASEKPPIPGYTRDPA
ncbi:hypothetical protein [Burkholderia stagnalis]|uniref:hypothetical protein n=1 Tax=Burkholderia stagnalis TaxID=1503054 RepID=UPI001E545E45|nr:hypothetical protein [Burkholderia stagnalis]